MKRLSPRWVAILCTVPAGVVLAQAPVGTGPGGPATAEPAATVALEAQAQASAPAAAPAAEAAPGADVPLRDPFWPVGHVPRRPEKPAVASGVRPSAAPAAPAPATPAPVANPVEWDEARRHLEVRGISRIARDKNSGQEAYFAVVGGRMVEAGDAVSVSWNGRVYRWRVSQIGPAGLQLVKIDSRAE